MNAAVASKPRKRTAPAKAAVPAKAAKPGRPPSVAQRQHLFLSEDALAAMAEIEGVMDAHGPSEVIRVALMHLQNALTARKVGLRLYAQSATGDRMICGLIDTYSPQQTLKKAHITMTPGAKARLDDCRERTGITSPSGVVILALLLLLDYTKAVHNGECVMATLDGEPLLGYTPLLNADRMRRAVNATKREAANAA